MKKSILAAIIIIFVLGYILRVLYLPQLALSFAYDQARDAFIIRELLRGDIKILGPSVSGVPGLYHGVLYYYLIFPFYFIGQGNPIFVAYGQSFLSSITLFIVFGLAYLLTKKAVPSLISALIFAFSYEASQYANLLTNASMAVWFVPILYLGLYVWITKFNKLGPIITGLGLGFTIQSDIALAYHLLPVIFWLWVFKKNIKRADVLKFIVFLMAATSTMILSEFRFGFKGISVLFYLLSSQDAIVQKKELGDILYIFVNQIGKSMAYTMFPLSISFGGLVGFAMLFYSLIKKVKKGKESVLSWQRYLATYILAHIVALPFGGTNMRHITAGTTAGIAVFIGIFLWKYFYKTKFLFIILLLLILFSNIAKIVKENQNGQTIFPLQEDLMLSKELDAVDYTYITSAGKPFSINTLTNPLYTNTLWSYLYNWQGQKKYGYLPSWRGKDQVGQLGNNLTKSEAGVDLHFFIIEPTYGIPQEYVTWGLGEENSRSKLIEEKKFGEIIVQERISVK